VIKIVWDEQLSNKAGEVMLKPQFYCDACGKRIKEDEEAIVKAQGFPGYDTCKHLDPVASYLGVYHKVVCDNIRESDDLLYWWDLDEFCKQLSVNYPLGRRRLLKVD